MLFNIMNVSFYEALTVRSLFTRGLRTCSARANNSRKSRPINLREQRTRYFNFYEYNTTTTITTTTYNGTFQNCAKQDRITTTTLYFFNYELNRNLDI